MIRWRLSDDNEELFKADLSGYCLFEYFMVSHSLHVLNDILTIFLYFQENMQVMHYSIAPLRRSFKEWHSPTINYVWIISSKERLPFQVCYYELVQSFNTFVSKFDCVFVTRISSPSVVSYIENR